MTSLLLRKPFSFAKSSVVNTNLDQSSRVMFSCAYKYLSPPTSVFLKMNTKFWVTFAGHLKLLKKWSRFSSTICLQVIYSISEEFVSCSFKFRIYGEMLRWAQLVFKLRINNFVDDIFQINLCCLDKKAMLGAFMLTYSVKSWKLSTTKFTLESDIRF